MLSFEYGFNVLIHTFFKMAKKYFLYARISNDDYEKSIDSQIQMLLKIATSDDKKINEEDIVVIAEHESGKKANKRPKFNKMMNDLLQDISNSKKKSEERVYGWILFFKIDRLARNDKDFEKLLILLDAWYQFISATETIENTPTGRLLFRLLAWFAVYESEKLSSRISLSRITALIKKEFESLGGDIVIFGYEYDSTQESIVVNNIEKGIIIKIYNQYLFGEKMGYRDIFNKFDKEYDWYLTKYLTKKITTKEEKTTTIEGKIKIKEGKIRTSKTTPEKFIRNIIVNTNSMKYNGFIEVKLSINDEWIKNYLDTIKQNDIDSANYSLEGDIKIGGDVKLVNCMPELMIVPEFLYKGVINKVSKSKNSLTENIEKWLFTGILFADHNWRSVLFSWKIDKKKWRYINYRTKIWNDILSISEKKIEDKILSKRYIKEIISSINQHIVEIKDTILSSRKDSESFKMKRKKIIASINIYRGMKEYFKSQLEIDKDKKNIEANLKSFKRYLSLEEEYIKKEKYLSGTLYEAIDKYLEISKIKQIKNESFLARRIFYMNVFKRITYSPISKDKFKLVLEPFTFLSDLWLPKEIVI